VGQEVLIAEYLRSRLGIDSNSAYEVTYYLWRRKRRPAPSYVAGRRLSAADDSDGGYTYEIWVVAIPRQRAVGGELSAESGSGPGMDLKQAVANVSAARVVGAIWRIDDLAEGQAATLIGMPEKLKGLVDEPLGAAAGVIGMPAPAAVFSGDVAGTLLLRPVMEPVENALHGLEIVGAIVGLVTGLHGLSALCLKHLVHDRITKMLGDAFRWAISGAAKAPDRRLSEAPGPAAAGRPAEPATVSWQPTPSEVTRVNVSSEPRIPQGRGRPTTFPRRRAAAGAPTDTPPAGPPLAKNPAPAVRPLPAASSAVDSRPGQITGPPRPAGPRR
jgi:hypothetical protein